MIATRYLSALLRSLLPLVGSSLGCPDADLVTPQLVDAAKKEGKVIFYTSIELQTAEKIGKAFEAAYPGITVQVERNGAERIFQRLAQERGSNIHVADAVEVLGHDRVHLLEAAGLAGALCAGGRSREMAGRSARPGWLFRDRAVYAVADHVQHQARQARGCAEKLRRSARQEMDRQDRQGSSRLQRHDHDGHLRAEPRPRLGLFQKARPATRHAGAVRRRSRRKRWRRASARSGRTAANISCCRSAARRARSSRSIRPKARHRSRAAPASSSMRRIRTPPGS